MANYDTLKATIDAYIRANYQKAITGPVLNGVLTAMVDSLGAGYLFMGEAVPSTDPGTPDQPVFYIAWTRGVYSNFDGRIMGLDDIGLYLWSDGAWTYKALPVAKDSALAMKQDLLRSGINIKTINSESLLGSGNIDIQGGGGDTSDCVKVTAQTWSDGQKTQARTNIGAGTSDFSGNYNDLTNKPTIPDVSGKADKVSGATNGHLAGLNASGNLTDSGKKASDFATAAQGTKADTAYQKPSGGIPKTDLASAVQTSLGKADTAVQPGDLATVATSGAYADLTGLPVIPQPQIQSDWDQADNTKKDYIKNKPTIPAAQVNSDWNAGSGVAQILNKPSIPDDLNDLSDIFVATYGTTTAAEVAAAITAGKIVLVERDNKLAIYSKTQSSYYYFYRAETDCVVQITLNTGTDAWAQQNNYFVTTSTARGVSTVLNKDSTGSQVPTSYSTYNAIHPATGSSQPAGGMEPNKLYNLGELSGAVTIALATPDDATIANHYYFTFDTGASAPTITWPAGITSWNGGSAPTISANKHYEISVLGGIGAYMEV